MTIAVLAKKGGVGKSTVTLLLYAAFRNAGKRVAIRDWDAQGTSSKALEAMGEAGDFSRTADAEIILYDTPPSLEHVASSVAVRAAEIVLVLTSPSPADIWEANEAVQFALRLNPAAAVCLVFNKVRKSTILGRLMEQSSQQVGAPVLPANISARECYQHAVAQGWKALDGPAREEILQLAVAVLSASGKPKHNTQST